MAKRKVYRPSKPKTFKPVKRTSVPTFPASPTPPPSQPKLDGFTTPELEEMEGAIEAYKAVEDRVKAEKKELTTELERAAMDLIEILLKHKQKNIVINGWSAQILDTIKVKVKGVPKLKSEKENFKDEVAQDFKDNGILAERVDA